MMFLANPYNHKSHTDSWGLILGRSFPFYQKLRFPWKLGLVQAWLVIFWWTFAPHVTVASHLLSPSSSVSYYVLYYVLYMADPFFTVFLLPWSIHIQLSIFSKIFLCLLESYSDKQTSFFKRRLVILPYHKFLSIEKWSLMLPLWFLYPYVKASVFSRL